MEILGLNYRKCRYIMERPSSIYGKYEYVANFSISDNRMIRIYNTNSDNMPLLYFESIYELKNVKHNFDYIIGN